LKIEGYLAWKWGVAGDVVTSSQFLSRPPLIGD